MQELLKVVLMSGFVLLSVVTSFNYSPTLGQDETAIIHNPMFNNTGSFNNFTNSSTQFITYTNPDYHFKIDYPSYLKPDETNLHINQAVKFIIPADDLSQMPDVDIGVFVRTGLPTDAKISDYLQYYQSLIYQSIQNGEMRPISSNISILGENEAIDQVYYDYSNDMTTKVNSLNIIKDGESFSLFYVTQPGLFNTYVKDFRQMANSLEILPNNKSLVSLVQEVDNYSNYFATVTQNSVNLTRDYQDKVGLWELGQITNNSMANLTNKYLNNFTTQLNQFNQTTSPLIFNDAKRSLASSFSNEIISYELFRDYLITGNETKNKISTDFLSKSLGDEANAFKYYKDVVNQTSP